MIGSIWHYMFLSISPFSLGIDTSGGVIMRYRIIATKQMQTSLPLLITSLLCLIKAVKVTEQ